MEVKCGRCVRVNSCNRWSSFTHQCIADKYSRFEEKQDNPEQKFILYKAHPKGLETIEVSIQEMSQDLIKHLSEGYHLCRLINS